MAFNFGSLIVGAAGARAKALAGQRAGEQEREARERQQTQDAFAAWAKRRQLENEQAQIQNLDQYRAGMLSNQETANDIRKQLGEQGNAIKELIAKSGTWGQQAQYGPGGTVDRTNKSRGEQAKIRADATTGAATIRANAPKTPATFVLTRPDGSVVVVPKVAGETGEQRAVSGAPTSQGIRDKFLKETAKLGIDERAYNEAVQAQAQPVKNTSTDLALMRALLTMTQTQGRAGATVGGVKLEEGGMGWGDRAEVMANRALLSQGGMLSNKVRQQYMALLQALHNKNAEDYQRVQQSYRGQYRNQPIGADSAFWSPDMGGVVKPQTKRSAMDDLLKQP